MAACEFIHAVMLWILGEACSQSDQWPVRFLLSVLPLAAGMDESKCSQGPTGFLDKCANEQLM